MPRQARRKSESGIYHIMLRGINQQQIFEDEEDGFRFLETLSKYKEQCGYEIYAYCLRETRGRFSCLLTSSILHVFILITSFHFLKYKKTLSFPTSLFEVSVFILLTLQIKKSIIIHTKAEELPARQSMILRLMKYLM